MSLNKTQMKLFSRSIERLIESSARGFFYIEILAVAASNGLAATQNIAQYYVVITPA